MKTFTLMKTRAPERRVARFLSEDREFTAFGDLLDYLWLKPLQQPLRFLDGTVTDDLEQDFFLVLQEQRCQRSELPIFVDGVNRKRFYVATHQPTFFQFSPYLTAKKLREREGP